jgi:hypothetical protein
MPAFAFGCTSSSFWLFADEWLLGEADWGTLEGFKIFCCCIAVLPYSEEALALECLSELRCFVIVWLRRLFVVLFVVVAIDSFSLVRMDCLIANDMTISLLMVFALAALGES